MTGGAGAVKFSNEFSPPYLSIPYGVNVLWDAYASFDLAPVTDAKFVREIFTGVYASNFGQWRSVEYKLEKAVDKSLDIYGIIIMYVNNEEKVLNPVQV